MNKQTTINYVSSQCRECMTCAGMYFNKYALREKVMDELEPFSNDAKISQLQQLCKDCNSVEPTIHTQLTGKTKTELINRFKEVDRRIQ
jgi:hypothetical protein